MRSKLASRQNAAADEEKGDDSGSDDAEADPHLWDPTRNFGGRRGFQSFKEV